MGPCFACAAPGPFGFDPRLAGLRSNGKTKWACADHRAGLPGKAKSGHKMDQLTDFLDDEADDLRMAAAEMARFWKSQGLGDAVTSIGAGQGYQGAKLLLGTYFAARAKRLEKEAAEARRNAPPI
jgi:hypothetical protein